MGGEKPPRSRYPWDGAEKTGSHPPASTLLHRFKADLGQQLPGFIRAGLGEASKVKDPSKDMKENSHQTGPPRGSQRGQYHLTPST